MKNNRIRSIGRKLLTFMIAGCPLGAALLVLWVGSARAQEPFVYYSPRPNAQMVSARTTIAVRHGTPIEPNSLGNGLFTVTGGQSGRHSGQVRLADDGQTVIFQPARDFIPGETVSVSIQDGLRTTSGTTLPGAGYSFTVSAKPLIDYKQNRRLPALPTDVDRTAAAGHIAAVDGRVAPPPYVTLPGDYPRLTVTVPATNTGNGYLFLTNFSRNPESPYLQVLDDSGDPVFYQKMLPGQRVHEFKPLANGQIAYYDYSAGIYRLLDEHYRESGTVAAGNGYLVDYHGIQVRDDGHMLLQIYDFQPVDMSQIVEGGQEDATVVGSIVQELDPSGNVIFQWRSWDHIPITDAVDAIDLTAETVDATHINSVEWDNDGNILISSRHLDEVTKIDRDTADVIWRMGGKGNQFTFVNDDRPFSHQHDARRQPDGNLTLYDNGNTNVPQYSRAVEYRLDEVNRIATKVWEYRNQPEDIYGFATGNAQRLSNGNTLIAWGGVGIGAPRPVLTEVMSDGTKALEMYFASGESSYRVMRGEWKGSPTWRPALAVNKQPGAGTDSHQARLHFSWNGATDVEAYHVYSGTTPATTNYVETVTKSAFEDTSVVPSGNVPCLFYRIVPVDEAGVEALYSNPVFAGSGACGSVVQLTPSSSAAAYLDSTTSRAVFTAEVHVEPGTVEEPSFLTYSDARIPPRDAPAGLFATDISFTLDRQPAGLAAPGSFWTQHTLEKPVTLILHYSDEAIHGLDEERLAFYRWDSLAQTWVQDGIELSQLDVYNNFIRVTTKHLAQFGVFATLGEGPITMQTPIEDGSFEQGPGNQVWIESSSNLPGVICDATCTYDGISQARSGDYWTFFGGGLANREEAYVSQQVELPPGRTLTATLSFWLRIPDSSRSGQDSFSVTLNGDEVFRAEDGDADNYASYTLVTLNVSPLLQRKNELRFDARLEMGSQTRFYLDDVSLIAKGIYDAHFQLYLPSLSGESTTPEARGSPQEPVATESDTEAALPTTSYLTAPADLPPLDVTAHTTGTADGYIFLAPYNRRPGATPYAPYLLIVDDHGELVYHKKLPAPAEDFKSQGNQLASYTVGGSFIHRLLDHTYREVETVTAAEGYDADFHDFQILPDGNRLLLIYEEQLVDMSQIVEGGNPEAIVVGCRIQEQDPAGNPIFSWSSFDHFAITDTYKSLVDSRIDYVHCNSIEEDSDGHLLLSSRDMSEVTKIHRRTGEVLWRLGGKNNQFDFVNAIDADDVQFAGQHDARRIPNGNLTLLDNRLGVSQYSRSVEYELDEDNLTATLVWEARNDPDVYAAIMGNAQRLPNGNTFIGWGSGHPSVTEVTEDGTQVLELSLPAGMQSYRAFRFPWYGHPQGPPTLVVETEVPTVTLHYSWNGATEVVAYHVYGDQTEYPSTLLTTEPRTGFETTTVFTDLVDAHHYNFRVVPLDVEGNPLWENQIADLSRSEITASHHELALGTVQASRVFYTVTLHNQSVVDAMHATLTTTLPTTQPPLKVSLDGPPICSSGLCETAETPEQILWQGEIAGESEVLISYTLTVEAQQPISLSTTLATSATVTARGSNDIPVTRHLNHSLPVSTRTFKVHIPWTVREE